MKILIATSSVTPNAGIPSYNRELCSLLGENNEMHLLVDENLTEYNGYQMVYTTSEASIYDYNHCAQIIRNLNQEKYDLIINSNSHIMAIIAPYMNDKTKIITISHSLGTMDCDNAAFNNRYIDAIVALSDNCRKYIEKRFSITNGNKIHVIFNSIVDKENADVLRKEKKKNEELKIVFAGGTAASKSPDIVIPIIWELCKTNVPFKFYWMGYTTPPLKKFQPFKDVKSILPEDPRVIETGLIPQREAAELIASCNIFLAPSRREGFPMALLEAMRVGCIPIVSDFDIANKEIIRDKQNGFVVSHNDTNGFVHLIETLVTHHYEYGTIYEESYKTFKNELSFPVWRKKILNLVSISSQSHIQRRELTKAHFKITVFKFKALDKINFIENHAREVTPCALKFYRFYKKLNNHTLCQ